MIKRIATAKRVEETRRELLAALADPEQIPCKVAAYADAVRRHRELVVADALARVRT